MKTTNAMQLKARTKQKAKEAGISPQLLMQDYMLERLLERLSLSPWRDKMAIKRGMLIASLVGVDGRVTKDLDATAQGFQLTGETAERALRDIAAIELDDDVEFEFSRIEAIREKDAYPGVRAFLVARYPPMAVTLMVDITTGDAVTPKAVAYEYPLMLEERSISLLAYPLATILAEKLETVISRGTASTRLRDYYDLFVLWKTRRCEVDRSLLHDALLATAAHRNSLGALPRWRNAMAEVVEDDAMRTHWASYAGSYRYASGIRLEEAVGVVCEIMSSLEPF